jgi:hypothetical protein
MFVDYQSDYYQNFAEKILIMSMKMSELLSIDWLLHHIVIEMEHEYEI